MKTMVKTKEMDRLVWLEERRKGVCGSDASIILGLSPYRSVLELWKDKTGQIPVEEKENQYTYFGTIMEPVIKREFMKRSGLKVRARNAILQSQTYPFMLADVDGIVKEEDGSYSIFEAKTASEYKKEIWEQGIPPEYMAQVQHYLCVTEYKKAYICALVGGNTYYCHEIYRDEKYISDLVEKEALFWDSVLTGMSPKADGSKATEEYLNLSYAKATKSETDLPEEAVLLVDSYLEIEADLKRLSDKKNLITNQLKDMMKENEKGHVGGHVIKWTNVEKRSLDSKKVRELLGTSYEDYLTVSNYRKFSVA